jgi:hypothetical protein
MPNCHKCHVPVIETTAIPVRLVATWDDPGNPKRHRTAEATVSLCENCALRGAVANFVVVMGFAIADALRGESK